jgi:DNA-binding MarR family transcriptional regulator
VSASTKARAADREKAVAELGAAFKGMQAAFRRLRGRETQRHDELSFAQCQLLFGLADRGDLSAGELATAADLSPATVTQMLDNLAQLGLVERTRSEHDRRIVLSHLTEQGRTAITERREHHLRRWREALAGFEPEELRSAAAVLDRLHELYDSYSAKEA